MRPKNENKRREDKLTAIQSEHVLLLPPEAMRDQPSRFTSAHPSLTNSLLLLLLLVVLLFTNYSNRCSASSARTMSVYVWQRAAEPDQPAINLVLCKHVCMDESRSYINVPTLRTVKLCSQHANWTKNVGPVTRDVHWFTRGSVTTYLFIFILNTHTQEN